MSPKTIFGLMRHAQTEWNREKRIQGQQNAPLTRQGCDSAKRWGHQLNAFKWDRLLCSDLGRARETTALINLALQLPVSSDARLREQNWGDWTARTIQELQDLEADRLAGLESAGWGFAPPGGETRRKVLQRSLAALATAARTWPGRRILVVCHEGVIKCLVYHFSGRRFLPGEDRVLEPGHLHLLSETRGRIALDQVNAIDLTGAA